MIVLEVESGWKLSAVWRTDKLEADVAKSDHETPFLSDVTRSPKHGLTVSIPAPSPNRLALCRKLAVVFPAVTRGNVAFDLFFIIFAPSSKFYMQQFCESTVGSNCRRKLVRKVRESTS